MHMRYTAAIDAAGDSVISHAGNIQQIGNDMYTYLRNLISSDQLSGEGIARALEESQARWNTVCEEFAQAERDFGAKTKEAYANMMAADARGGSLIA